MSRIDKCVKHPAVGDGNFYSGRNQLERSRSRAPLALPKTDGALVKMDLAVLEELSLCVCVCEKRLDNYVKCFCAC